MPIVDRTFAPGEKKLKDVAPIELCFGGEYLDTKAYSFRDVEVVQEYHNRPWIGTHKNVTVWWVLKNGYAVAWNENVARGWSFPVVKVK